jgi:hypothetical protein
MAALPRATAAFSARKPTNLRSAAGVTGPPVASVLAPCLPKSKPKEDDDDLPVLQYMTSLP